MALVRCSHTRPYNICWDLLHQKAKPVGLFHQKTKPVFGPKPYRKVLLDSNFPMQPHKALQHQFFGPVSSKNKKPFLDRNLTERFYNFCSGSTSSKGFTISETTLNRCIATNSLTHSYCYRFIVRLIHSN